MTRASARAISSLSFAQINRTTSGEPALPPETIIRFVLERNTGCAFLIIQYTEAGARGIYLLVAARRLCFVLMAAGTYLEDCDSHYQHQSLAFDSQSIVSSSRSIAAATGGAKSSWNHATVSVE